VAWYKGARSHRCAFNSGSINKAELAESYCADHPAHAVELAKLFDHLQE
jgi:hypothetical protein